MKILDVEIEFDFLDADDVERLENEAEKVKEECQIKSKQKMRQSEIIKEECNIIERFFDNVFGNGTSEKLFRGKKNLNNEIKAFEDIINYKIEQQIKLKNTLDRYQPNREQRRYNQFKGNKK